MSLLLDALKEAEARKREAGAAAAARADADARPDPAPTLEIEGSLALAEDVVTGPEPEGGMPRAAQSASRPAASPAPAGAPQSGAGNAAAAALLAARAARAVPAAKSPTAAAVAPAAVTASAPQGVVPGPAATTPAAAAPVPATGSGSRRPLPWLIAAGVLLAVLLGAMFLLDTGNGPGAVPRVPAVASMPAPTSAAAQAIDGAPGLPRATEPGAPQGATATGPPGPGARGDTASVRAPAQAAAMGRAAAFPASTAPDARARARAQARAGREREGAASVAPAGEPVRIEISRETAPLQAAWNALQAGDVARAEALYRRVLDGEPGQVDAQLALAVIAQSRGDDEGARRGYRSVLESVPDHPRAWGGLAELAGEGEAGAVESRLRQLLAAQASAPLHFALGNLLARQQRWDDAQVEYFAAASLAPQAPDYAFNVAVALERIGKGAAALSWYNRSLELVGRGRAARFDVAAVRARVAQLQAAPP